jgi:hypothetical protein
MGKAKHPHNSKRPEPARIRKALEAQDIQAVIAGLTTRQRHFAEEYVVDFNGMAAAIRAGYSPQWADRQAHVLTKHEGIKAYIDHLSKSKEAKIVSIDPDYLIQKVHEIIMKENARDGDVLRALELLMKHKGCSSSVRRSRVRTAARSKWSSVSVSKRIRTPVIAALKRMKKPDLKAVNE